MNYIDHPILYSDKYGATEWIELVSSANVTHQSYWRRYSRRKMRRCAKELLRGVRPRINLGY